MRRGWKRPHLRNSTKLRSAPPVWAFIFQSWTRTFICRRFCRVFLGPGSGWHPGLAKRVENREAPSSKKLQEPMENWEEGREKQVEVASNLRRRRRLIVTRLPYRLLCVASTLLYGSISARHVGHLSLQPQLQTSTHSLPSLGQR